MPIDHTSSTALADAGRALERMVSTLGTKKVKASKSERIAVRTAMRDAARSLRKAGCSKAERDVILKPYQLSYDPGHRTR